MSVITGESDGQKFLVTGGCIGVNNNSSMKEGEYNCVIDSDGLQGVQSCKA